MRTILLSLVLLATSACVSRKEVEADIWLVKKIPLAQCPAGKNHGFYRKITCRNRDQHPLCKNGDPYYIERVSFCSDRAEDMLSMKRTDAEKYLQELTSPRRQ